MPALRACLLTVLLLGMTGSGSCAGPFPPNAVLEPGLPALDSTGVRTPKRWLAAVLTVAVGPFGGHRVYLGTTPKVPLLYSLTFGGFGVLVLIDLGHVLFTPDLGPYRENGHVFMWRSPEGRPPTPP